VPARSCVKQNLIIISAGKLGRETYGWAAAAMAQGAPWRIKGFLDARANILEGMDYEQGVIGDVANYQIQPDDVFIGAIGEPKDKVKYYTPILERGGKFINLIHPTACIGKNVRLGTGVILAPFTCTTSDLQVGNFVTVLPYSNLTHDNVIGDWCQISSHCGVNGNVTLGEGVFLGGHTCVVPQVSIGAWTFVCAGSVVVRSLPAGVKVFGNPARPVASVIQK